MRSRTRWALLVGALVMLAGLLLWRSLAPGHRSRPPADFSATSVPIDSGDLAFAVDEVRGQVREGRTDWHCRLRCREPGGCNAQILVTVHYRSAGRDRRVTLAGQVATQRGEVAELAGSQRPVEPVDAIDRVEVVVEQRLRPDGSGSIAYE